MATSKDLKHIRNLAREFLLSKFPDQKSTVETAVEMALGDVDVSTPVVTDLKLKDPYILDFFGQVQFLLEKDFFCKISLPILTNLFLKTCF